MRDHFSESEVAGDIREGAGRQKKLILASASPRRREILKMAGYEFTVLPAAEEERAPYANPDETVKKLALMKALDAARQVRSLNSADHSAISDVTIIGADTVVALRGQIYGKPVSGKDARRMLRLLRGNTHQVYTGVAILDYDKEGNCRRVTHAERTDVTVSPMSDDEILDYLAHEDVMDKAGAYAIQGRFAAHIKRIEGDYLNVVGLPLAYLYDELKRLWS